MAFVYGNYVVYLAKLRQADAISYQLVPRKIKELTKKENKNVAFYMEGDRKL